MLKIKDGFIVTPENKKIYLRGINLGAWLMMEGYFLYGRNIPECEFKREFEKIYGKNEAEDFTELYRNNFIKEKDFEDISRLGFNCIRLPFNHKLIENQDRKFSIRQDGLDFLKKAISWCERYRIYCILDMHAAPGSQNEDWHSDNSGKANLWTDRKCQERFFRLWEILSDAFRDKDIIAGYDLLNEPVIKKSPQKILRPFYKEAVKRIRKIDKHRIIFLEGNCWAQILEHVGKPFDEHIAYSNHYYQPLDFTFHLHRNLIYPGRIMGDYWNQDTMKRNLEVYHSYCKKYNAPLFAGEFGVNFRNGYDGELRWLSDVLKIFDEFEFHWTYWTYKAVSNTVFPDGIYQYEENPGWVNRQGPIYGWENFYTLWRAHKKDIVKSWDTAHFVRKDPIINLLVNHTRI
jgi:aryl-phospho-beta-D-glucosidase BglC (GH1 family)